MRRGHPGIGRWRSENQRHFRPRSGGVSPYRPFKPVYPLLETPTFPPPGIRPPQGNLPYNVGNTVGRSENNIRNFRFNRGSGRPYRYQGHHHRYPFNNEIRPKRSEQNKYYFHKNEKQSEQCHINSMGDIDDRQAHFAPNQLPASDWSQLDGQSIHKNIELNKANASDYEGHRPPSSDHYGNNSAAPTDNSDAFSRSIDDTVNIVRERLMNRHDTQHQSNLSLHENTYSLRNDSTKPTFETENIIQQQPTRKRMQRQRQNIKSDCDKIKNKIVHQFFKMDKEKIHKLMDNPSSSTKFEFAISSLITESQNSLNRHLRSVAEKSLCDSSTEFIVNDNTIYEDTFMKQMQCILDPQDTVLLEDMKPLVMEELRKVLQLQDFDETLESVYPVDSETRQNDETINNNYGYNEVVHEQNVGEIFSRRDNFQSRSQILTQVDSLDVNKNNYVSSEKIYERRSPRRSTDHRQNVTCSTGIRFPVRSSTDNQSDAIGENLYQIEPRLNIGSWHNVEKAQDKVQSRQTDNWNMKFDDKVLDKEMMGDHLLEQTPVIETLHRPIVESYLKSDTKENVHKWPDNVRKHQPTTNLHKLFSEKSSEFRKNEFTYHTADNNTEEISDDEYPFAELDKQYHVAVDPSLIVADDDINTNNVVINSHNSEKEVKQESTLSIHNEITNFDNNQLGCTTHSPTKSSCTNVASAYIHTDTTTDESINVKNEIPSDSINTTNNIVKPDSEMKSPISSKLHKRSTDLKPVHRKEKRKKSETSQIDSKKKILNKNIIINLTDCVANKSEKFDSGKSIFNLYFSKDESRKQQSKDNPKIELIGNEYSDAHVKRKEKSSLMKAKLKENRLNKKTKTVLRHPVSKENVSEVSKFESKSKLRNIDMFVCSSKKSKKVQKNINNGTKSLGDENKLKQTVSMPKFKIVKRHVGTQVLRKLHSKEIQTNLLKNTISRHSQTEETKKAVRAVQTDPKLSEKPSNKATDTLERMKEIDLEIQILLQEKFQLYNSLESKGASNTVPTLGMTVLNVTKEDDILEDALSEDAIVADFTNIPVEELEQIAFEAADNQGIDVVSVKKLTRQQKLIQTARKKSESPTNTNSNRRNSKTPNISLIEQIITDDRPLEDIILLDDFEDEDDLTVSTLSKQSILESGADSENLPLQSRMRKRKRYLKKKLPKKVKKPKISSGQIVYEIKPCSVVLLRQDLSKYINEQGDRDSDYFSEVILDVGTGIAEETILNEFDMLDVSEDIVIGESCEVKLTEDKDDRLEVPLSEDMILGNSQSSSDDLMSPNVASNNNQCRMYDFSTDENLRKDSIMVSGNGDAVLAIECIDNNFIAACLDGNVYYFSGDGQLINTLRGSNLAVTCLTIVKEKYGTTIYTGSLDSRIRYYDLETGLEKGSECNVLSPIQTMDRAWDTIFVGTRTGFVLQFECKNNMLIPVSTVKFSEQSILALRAMKEGPRKVLLVAARSENVTIKDAQTGLLLRTLEGPKMTVYTLLYEDGKVYCGTSSHQIHVFDYSTGCHAGTHEGGKGAVCLRAVGGLLFAGCYDGCVYVYRDGEARPFAQLRGPGLMLLSLAVQGTKIIAGYKDRSLHIWRMPLSILQEMIL